MAWVNRFLTPIVEGLQQQAPFCSVFIIIQSCFQNVAAWPVFKIQICLFFSCQLIFFGLSNQLVVSFKEENTVAFKHLFLKGYSGVDEDDYSCSIYTQQDAYDSIFYVINQVSVCAYNELC